MGVKRLAWELARYECPFFVKRESALKKRERAHDELQSKVLDYMVKQGFKCYRECYLPKDYGRMDIICMGKNTNEIAIVEVKSYPLENVKLPDIYQLIKYANSVKNESSRGHFKTKCDNGTERTINAGTGYRYRAFLAFSLGDDFVLVELPDSLTNIELGGGGGSSPHRAGGNYVIGLSCRYCGNGKCPFNAST